ncbi:MAG: radical SAM protein [archaeon]|nr:radical SAM protein [archaeon]
MNEIKSEALLVNPASRSISDRPPLHFMYMASYNEMLGIPTNIVDVKALKREAKQEIEDRIIDEISKSGAKIVGFTCTTPEITEVKRLATRTKEVLGKDVITVVGGIHATVLPEELIMNSDIDFALTGEAEKTFAELSTTENPFSVKGLVYEKNNEITNTGSHELMDLKEMPPLDYSKIDMDFYTKPSMYVIRGIPLSGFYLFTSRGCSFKCTYCANPTMFGNTIRYFPTEKIADELETLNKKYKVDSVFFYDDTFTMDRNHVRNLCNELLNRDIHMLWGCQTRANMVDKELLLLMKKAGCVQMEFGIESGSDKVLRRVKKGVSPQQVKDTFKVCKSVGVKTFANFMFNLPDETIEDLEMTLNLAREIKPEVSIFNITIPFPGSPMQGEFRMNPDDYEKFNNFNYEEMVKFINEKYKLASYDESLMELEKKIVSEFPSIHGIKVNRKTAGILWSNVKFLLSAQYLNMFARSQRKNDYIKFGLNFGRYLKKLERSYSS